MMTLSLRGGRLELLTNYAKSIVRIHAYSKLANRRHLGDDGRMRRLLAIAGATIVGFSTGCASQPEASEIPWPDGAAARGGLAEAPVGAPEHIEDVEGVDNCYFDGAFCIASQPSPEAIRGFADAGATVVISLRTDDEMEDLDFDQAALCHELGMEYVHIPLGGPDRIYTRQSVDAFADALERHDNKAVIHCASGGRATYMWVAYLVEHRGYEFDEAMAVGEQIRFRPSPFEGLLGREVVYSLGPPVED